MYTDGKFYNQLSALEREIGMKFRHTLLIIFLLFSLVPLYALGAVLMYENDRNIEDVMTEGLESISKTQIQDIKNFCQERKEYLEMIGQYDMVKEAILISLDGTKELEKSYQKYLDNMLDERTKSNLFVSNLFILDADFRMVSSSGEYTLGEVSTLKDEVDPKCLSGEFLISQVYKRRIRNNEYRVVAAYAGVYNEKELIGYIVEEIPTSYFDQYRASVNLSAGGTMYITDGNNQIITAGSSGEEANRAKYIVTEEERRGFNELWKKIDWEKNPAGSFTYMVDGRKYITYYSNIDYTDWTIRINGNLSAYHQRTQKFRQLLIMSLAILTAALLLVNLYLSNRLTKPLGRIVNILSRVRKEHDYSLRVNNKSKDEFGILSREVDELLFYAETAERREQRKQKHLQRRAEKDPLTGIYNKAAIGNYIEQTIEGVARNGGDIVVGFVDIDDFRDYNTKYGHQAGDDVICFVANSLQEQIGNGVGRNGGDEFLFCLTQFAGREEIVYRMKALVQKFNQGFYSEKVGKNIAIPCSIGVTIAKADESTHESLIEDADEAMYHAKENGKNGYFIL
jgi:diguanylate cyclase (GGDEF)-like protein